MRAKIWFLVKYYLFWIVLSILAKVIFLLYEKGDALQVTDYFQIFYRGLQLDFSLGGYIMMLACLITAFTPFVRESIIKSCFAVLTFILLILFWTVVVVDLELFKNWGYHINIEDMDEFKLLEEIIQYNITMCGYGPVMTTIILSKMCGKNTSEILAYKTSGDISGDLSSVVGYASGIFK